MFNPKPVEVIPDPVPVDETTTTDAATNTTIDGTVDPALIDATTAGTPIINDTVTTEPVPTTAGTSDSTTAT